MGTGPLRLASLLASILVGIGAGVVAADMRDPDAPADPDASALDPLGIDADMVDLKCTDESILILGTGDNASTLQAAVADFADARYLRIAKSCDTYLHDPDARNPNPTYAAYLGPWDTMREACELRTAPPHLRTFATRLRSGNEDAIKCWCVLPSSAWPVLEPGITPDEREEIAIRQLQSALIDLGRLPDEGWPTGVYDQATIDEVNELNPGTDDADGVVDAETWSMVRRRVCTDENYVF